MTGISMDRLRGLAVRFVFAGALGLAFATAGALAAPQVRSQAPGYYRMLLGEFEVTALSDGTLELQVDRLLTNIEPQRLGELLERAFLQPVVETSVNGYLINTGAALVLIDAGAGSLLGDTVGKLAGNLRAAGYRPEQIDHVLITHMHPDHLGGLTSAGRRVFPNAAVYVNDSDAAYWLSPEARAQAAPQARSGFDHAIAAMEPYADAGKLRRFKGETEIVPGVRALPAHGHTPGHSIYVVESRGEKLVLWGDLVHVAAVQFPQPSVTIRFDSDSNAARVQREKAFADAARQGYWVGIAHVSFPGLGHVRAEGDGYVWVPANYTALRPPAPPIGR